MVAWLAGTLSDEQRPNCCLTCVKDFIANQTLLQFQEDDAVRLSSERYGVTRCHWQECGAILESGQKLRVHAEQHALDKQTVNRGFLSFIWLVCDLVSGSLLM